MHSFTDAAGLVADLAARHPDRTVFVGVDGLSCAGKTTFADHLATRTGAVVVHGDDLSRAGRPLWEHERFVFEVAEPLLAGRDAAYVRWHWTSPTAGPTLVVPAGTPLVVVEGVHVLDEAVGFDWDVRVWLDVDDGLRLERARAREGGARWECWSTNWMPRELAYVSTQDPAARADVVVDGNSAVR